MPNSGLLQSGLITLYMVYLTWSAMANNPDAQCNPMISIGNDTTPDSSTANPNTDPQPSHRMDTTSIIGLIIWFLCLLYSSMRTSSSTQASSRFIISTIQQFDVRIIACMLFSIKNC